MIMHFSHNSKIIKQWSACAAKLVTDLKFGKKNHESESHGSVRGISQSEMTHYDNKKM